MKFSQNFLNVRQDASLEERGYRALTAPSVLTVLSLFLAAQARAMTPMKELLAAASPGATFQSVSSINEVLTPSEIVTKRVIKELSERYAGARVQLTGDFKLPWDGKSKELQPISVNEVSFVSDEGKGEARFLIEAVFRVTEDGESKKVPHRFAARVPFSAWIKAPVAVRRIRPKEQLGKEMFREEEVNVATGRAREFRGLIVSFDTNFSELESTQTILEGHYPLMNGVQKIPSVRRGEAIRLRLISGALVLMTTGLSQEQGSPGDTVRVMAEKTKKQLSGVIQNDGTVEVKL